MKLIYPFFFLCISIMLDAQVGPAGICDLDDEDLLFWFSPEYGLSDSSGYITSWRSRASHLLDSSDGLPGILLEQANAARRPFYALDTKGRSSYVEFDGIDDFLEAEEFDDLINTKMSVLMVFRYTELDTSHSAIFAGHPTSNDYSWQLAYKGGSIRVYNGFGGISTNIKIESTPDEDWHIYYVEVDDYNMSVYLDGQYIDNESSLVAEMKKLYTVKLGQNRESNIYAETNLGDVVAFGRILNDFERIRLFNSFSAKYDISLAYQDYFDEGLSSEYGLNVVGAGKYNEDSYLEVKGENGMSIALNSGVENGEMFFVGQSNLGLENSVANMPSNLLLRLKPTFAFHENGHIGSVSFSIDSSIIDHSLEGTIKMIVSSDTLFTDSDTEYDMALSEGSYSSDIDFDPNSISYAIIGSVNMPLFISLLNFDAFYDLRSKSNVLEWNLESNGDPYTIYPEKSLDGISWSSLSSISVQCTGTCGDSYVDDDSGSASVYYRLKLVGANGDLKYSRMERLMAERERMQHAFYPNPNSGKLQFYNRKSGNLSIRTPEGKLVLQCALLNEKEVNLEALDAGLYFLQLESLDNTVIHQRLMIQN